MAYPDPNYDYYDWDADQFSYATPPLNPATPDFSFDEPFPTADQGHLVPDLGDPMSYEYTQPDGEIGAPADWMETTGGDLDNFGNPGHEGAFGDLEPPFRSGTPLPYQINRYSPSQFLPAESVVSPGFGVPTSPPRPLPRSPSPQLPATMPAVARLTSPVPAGRAGPSHREVARRTPASAPIPGEAGNRAPGNSEEYTLREVVDFIRKTGAPSIRSEHLKSEHVRLFEQHKGLPVGQLRLPARRRYDAKLALRSTYQPIMPGGEQSSQDSEHFTYGDVVDFLRSKGIMVIDVNQIKLEHLRMFEKARGLPPNELQLPDSPKRRNTRLERRHLPDLGDPASVATAAIARLSPQQPAGATSGTHSPHVEAGNHPTQAPRDYYLDEVVKFVRSTRKGSFYRNTVGASHLKRFAEEKGIQGTLSIPLGARGPTTKLILTPRGEPAPQPAKLAKPIDYTPQSEGVFDPNVHTYGAVARFMYRIRGTHRLPTLEDVSLYAQAEGLDPERLKHDWTAKSTDPLIYLPPNSPQDRPQNTAQATSAALREPSAEAVPSSSRTLPPIDRHGKRPAGKGHRK
ncbi:MULTISPECIES: hypothetical protein [Micromonospora]|uniref:Uncharacterized protein n=1 Tax=Micromonospora yangpuensis TaxID=683228 RepID=A0A1C6U5F4_9ACTN|nr:hypothetical protein [Micromonospora yangpuensis]GGL91730.1 hypothetical protein GCM10012279_06820 [Micromonospora yangpuensis]SCL49286.1 hypothetical protein GA0070617_1135 [Micromonospora yangpuensis]